MQEDEPDDDDFMVSFAEIQFDPKEDNIYDNMLMSGKQFMIVNHKLNSFLQIQAYTGARNFVTGVEVDIMLNSQENWLKLCMEKIEQQHDERLKHHARTFEYEVTKLRDVAKERHEFFVE